MFLKKFFDFWNKQAARWKEQSPVLLFAFSFAVLIILVYAAMLTPLYSNHVQPFVVHINARLAAFLLNLFGHNTTAEGSVVGSVLYSVNVKRGCDALLPAALFSAAVLAFPFSNWHNKITGIFIGVAFLLTMNLIRIVSLYLTGLYYPKAFDMMHLEVWQVIFILLSIICWGVWAQWAIKKRRLALEKNAHNTNNQTVL